MTPEILEDVMKTLLSRQRESSVIKKELLEDILGLSDSLNEDPKANLEIKESFERLLPLLQNSEV